MSNESLIKNYGNIFLFANHDDDFGAASATAANDLLLSGFTVTDVQMDLTSITASTGAWQSAKADFTAARPAYYVVQACVEFAAAVGAGDTVDFYIAPSNNSTATDGNVGNTSGADATYTDETGLLAQTDYIGSLVCDDTGVVQMGNVGIYVPKLQYGNLIMVNNADQATATAADETHIVFTPLVYYPGA